MINSILFTALALFLIMVFFDLWRKEIPSILGTSTVLVLAIVNIQNLSFGVLSFVFAWFLYEAGTFQGLADIKMITSIGFLIPSVYGFIALMIVLTLFTAIYNVIMRLGLKIESEYAGTVPIFLSLLILLSSGVLA